ncbi:MAG: hypothetical protein U0136_14255 [Bdellovibrionota bacterium]
MKLIIIIVFVLLGATFVADFLKKRAAQKAKQPEPIRMQTANEAPPTETGRLRVAEIVKALKKPDEHASPESASPESANQTTEDDSKLPDPFEGNPSNK